MMRIRPDWPLNLGSHCQWSKVFKVEFFKFWACHMSNDIKLVSEISNPGLIQVWEWSWPLGWSMVITRAFIGRQSRISSSMGMFKLQSLVFKVRIKTIFEGDIMLKKIVVKKNYIYVTWLILTFVVFVCWRGCFSARKQGTGHRLRMTDHERGHEMRQGMGHVLAWAEDLERTPGKGHLSVVGYDYAKKQGKGHVGGR